MSHLEFIARMLYDICPSVLCSCPMILESGDGIRILYSYSNMYPFFFIYLILHTLNSGEGEASLRCVSCVAWSFSSSVYEYAMYDMDRLQLCLHGDTPSWAITRYYSIGVWRYHSYDIVRFLP